MPLPPPGFTRDDYVLEDSFLDYYLPYYPRPEQKRIEIKIKRQKYNKSNAQISKQILNELPMTEIKEEAENTDVNGVLLQPFVKLDQK